MARGTFGANAASGSISVNPATRGILGGGTRPATGADLTGRLTRRQSTRDGGLTIPARRRTDV